MRRYLIEQWYEVEECECGGLLVNPANVVYMSNPPQRDYTCNKCGKVKRLSSDKWPHFSTTQKETIDSALADTGNTDAEQLVGQIRDHFHSDPDEDGIRKTEWDIDIDEAASLIEQYGRRVPRAMLREIGENSQWNGLYEDIYQMQDEIAAKYGVR